MYYYRLQINWVFLTKKNCSEALTIAAEKKQPNEEESYRFGTNGEQT
jgi:hypothetical protein